MEKDYRYKSTLVLTENYFKLGLNPTELVLLEYILFKFQCNKIVWFTENTKKKIQKKLNVNAEQLESAINTLIEKKYISQTEKRKEIYFVDDFFYTLICNALEEDYYWCDVLWQSSTQVEAVKEIADKESKELL